MRLTWKDGVATVLVAAIVVPYVGYLIQGRMPFIQDPTGMAGVGLVLGIAAAAFGGWVILRAGAVQRFLTDALAVFGEATHSLADFYAHTNWIELAVARHARPRPAPLLGDRCDPRAFPSALQSGYSSHLKGGLISGCPRQGPPPPFRYCDAQLNKDDDTSGHHGHDRYRAGGWPDLLPGGGPTGYAGDGGVMANLASADRGARYALCPVSSWT